MNTFEFAFTLFGLVLGLALAEALKGFVFVLKARSFGPNDDRRIEIGVQTPLLALVVTLDLVSFWLGAWEVRDAIPVDFFPLVVGTLIAGIYYIAASLLFPDDPLKWPVLDHWFARHKAQIALGIFAANLLFSASEALLFGTWSTTWGGRLYQVVYLALALALIFTRRRWQSLAVLVVMLSVFVSLALNHPLLN